jgi:hypothetical protein
MVQRLAKEQTMRKLTLLLIPALMLAACGTPLPPEAVTTAESTAKALESEDPAAFASVVLPSQREGALGLPDGFPVEADKPSELTLRDMFDIEFFMAIKSVEVSDDAELKDETSGTVFLKFDYEDESFVVKPFTLKKEGEKWYIDFTETLKAWYVTDGVHALSVMELK